MCSPDIHLGDFERIPGHCRDFTRDADHAVQVGAVRSDFEVIDHIPGRASEVFGERLAHLCVFAQDEQTVGIVGQAQFFGRAHHPLADDTEDPAFLDDEWLFLARLQRQRVVRKDERHLVADFVVLRAANDGALALAIIDLAHRQLFRAGHVVAREDLRDDDALELARELLHTFDFEAKHREPFGQFLGRPVEINVLFQPVECDLHCEV